MKNANRNLGAVVRAVAVAAVVLSVLIPVLARGQNEAKKHPGLEPYTPTKLEWFALEMQARHGGTSEKTGIEVQFLPKRPDTVVIRIRHLPQAGIEQLMDHYVERVRESAGERGYKWLKIERAFDVRNLAE